MALSDFVWHAGDTHHLGVVCDARYDDVAHEFVVSARRLNDGRVAMSRIKAQHAPRHSGVDYFDGLAIRVEAAKLADQITAQSIQPVERSA